MTKPVYFGKQMSHHVYVFSFDGGQEKRDKKTNNDLQNTTQKTKDWAKQNQNCE